MDRVRTGRDAVAASLRPLARIARSAVPALADFCLVYLVVGTHIVCVAAAHTSRAGERLVRTLAQTYRIRRVDRSSTVAHVIASGRPALRTAILSDPTASGVIADLHRQLDPRSALVVPVVTGDRVAGAVSLCYAASGRTYSRADLPEASRLAARAAHILSPTANVRLRTAARQPRQGPPLRRRVAPRD
jgi:GAF domain-containing protein